MPVCRGFSRFLPLKIPYGVVRERFLGIIFGLCTEKLDAGALNPYGAPVFWRKAMFMTA